MNDFIYIILIIAASIGYYIYKRYRTRKLFKTRKVFEELNKTLKVRFYKGNLFNAPRLSGNYKNIKIIIKKNNDNKQYDFFKIFIRHKIKIKGLFRIVGGVVYNFKKDYVEILFSDQESMQPVLTGVPGFDDKIRIVQSNRCNVFSLLNTGVRDMLLTLGENVSAFNISNTIFELYFSREMFYDVENMRKHFEAIAALSDKLCLVIDERRALMNNIRMENHPTIKEKFARLLVEKYPIDNDIKDVLRELLKDDNYNNIIFAAEHLEQEGLEFLFRLLRSQKIYDINYIIKIIQIFQKGAYSKSSEYLIDMYNMKKELSVKLEILRAFKIFSSDKLSPFLVQQLYNDESEIVKEAVDALSTCGTVDSVEPLFKIAKNSLNPFFRDAVSKTIVQIQARLGDVETGWLSLDELKDKEGGLSMEKGAGEGSLTVSESDDSEENSKD